MDVPPPVANALTLSWTFGFSGAVHSLASHDVRSPGGERSAIFYTSSHTGIIYDYKTKTQQLLQGHCNKIQATVISPDKKWIATADAGPDNVIVVWDSITGTPVKTIFNPHQNGTAALAISEDSMCLASLSQVDDVGEQELSLWEWTVESEGALYTSLVPGVVSSDSAHTSVSFDPADHRVIVTNGPHKVTFWTWENFQLKPYNPVLSKRDSGVLQSSTLISSLFLPDTTTAVTSTTSGDLILWDAVPKQERPEDEEEDPTNFPEFVETNPLKSMVKSIRLSEGQISYLGTTMDKYLVVAGEDGCVRFYDFSLRIMAWYEDLNAGPVTSVSFASNVPGNVDDSASDFVCPDFVVGTATSYIIGVECALFQEIEPENRRGAVLVQGIGDHTPCIAAHPTMDRLVIGVADGTLQLWDFMTRTLLMVQDLMSDGGVKQRPQSCQFDGAGRALALGMTSGMLKVSDPDSLQEMASFTNGDMPITTIRFSPDSSWLAYADTANFVYVLNFAIIEEAPQPEDDDGSTERSAPTATWNYVGRIKSHTKAITGLEFTVREDGRLAMVSVAEDRTLVEYDLSEATPGTGIKLRGEPTKIEQIAVPTACMWHPLLGGDFEDRVVTANNEFKFKQWNADNKSCRRTSLCPTYGGPLTSLQTIPAINPERNQFGPSPYVVYSTAEKVIGIVKIPFDGNPHKAMGLIAHPTAISSITVSGDGRFVMSAGGEDRCVNIWQISTATLDRKCEEAAAKAEGLGSAEMYSELIDEETKNDLIDFFYYAQLRTQGEDSMEERKITGLVALSELPNLVRSLGYYPSEEECAAMIAEVYYAKFTETGETCDTIDLDTFIKLYVNHKSVFGTSKGEIEDAFSSLGAGDGRFSWGKLVEMLKNKGENIAGDDLKNIMKALVGGGVDGVNPASLMNAAVFSDKILGFDEDGGAMDDVKENFNETGLTDLEV
ncbi:hypothetical protein TrLO_g13606 [Triparma laevis f. longispina]|uniref:Cilia- and flagella-associated protein 251 n=1 Tax=Triparma laevis f. longispina TaxID=1714387 RepID=A0A9W6ZMR9_9STRA|nr:hypothetical protein TrLO_g13606 [Triparma laevis f. longispina]